MSIQDWSLFATLRSSVAFEDDALTDLQTASQLAAAMSDTPAPIYQRVKQAIISRFAAAPGNRISGCRRKANW